MNKPTAEYFHPLEALYQQDCEPIMKLEDICDVRDLSLYFAQRLGPTTTSMPMMHGSAEILASIEPMLLSLGEENPGALRDILIIPLGDVIVVASHIERNGVGNEAIASFRRNAKTAAQHQFAKDFAINALRTQLLRHEWVFGGGEYHSIAHAEVQEMEPTVRPFSIQ